MKVIETIDLVPLPVIGKRICSFYSDEEERKSILLKIIDKSLKLNNKVVYICKDLSSLQQLKTIDRSEQVEVYDKLDYESFTTQEFQALQIIEDNGTHPLNFEQLVQRELLFHEMMLTNPLLNKVNLFSTKQLSPKLLSQILELYPYYSIGIEECVNNYYIPLEYYHLDDLQKELNTFNYKLTKLRSSNKENSARKAALYKLAHDLKSPIRIANIMNSFIQANQTISKNSEVQDYLTSMANSLAQAYERINEIEKLAKDING